MKKKIYVLLLVLASVIACMVCLAACNNGDGTSDANRGEYVGEYEFVSVYMDGVYTEAGENGLTEDFIKLDLNENGNFVYQVRTGTGTSSYMTMTGSWTIKGDKLELTYKDGSGSKMNASLLDGVLTMSSSYDTGSSSITQVIKLKKVVEQNSAE